MQDVILSPADFVGLLNQTLEYAYPTVVIEGELTNFRVSKNRWIYFDLQDELASVKFFGTVYNLPGPLEDGLKIRVAGAPRLHPRFGFSVNITFISAVGEGSIKKAAQLLQVKLEKEGLFDPARKRPLPAIPRTVGLITAGNSAAYADFIKILNERWSGVEVRVADVYVQGQQAPGQIVSAIEHFSAMPQPVEVLVITRGGGSAEDLAAFSDERVVRAVAASRVPTLVAVGHEVDTSLAELAADMRASTPSNAAQLLVPDKQRQLIELDSLKSGLGRRLLALIDQQRRDVIASREYLTSQVFLQITNAKNNLNSLKKLLAVFDPAAALKRGYAIVSRGGKHINSVHGLKTGDSLAVQLNDGTIGTKVEEVL